MLEGDRCIEKTEKCKGESSRRNYFMLSVEARA